MGRPCAQSYHLGSSAEYVDDRTRCHRVSFLHKALEMAVAGMADDGRSQKDRRNVHFGGNRHAFTRSY